MKNVYFIFFFFISFISSAQNKIKQKYPCDLNNAFHINIPYLKFKNCERQPENSQTVLTANYIVETKNNYQLEKYLRSNYKMGKIVRFKWAYEIENNKFGLIKSFKNTNGELLDLEVSMFGEMKLYTDSKSGKLTFDSNRDEVPCFSVTISLSKTT